MAEKYLLHKAVKGKLMETVRFLLDHKFDVNLQDQDGKSPLHLAVETDQEEIVKVLLEAGADVKAKDKYNKTALDTAVLSSEFNEKIVKMLIDAKSDVNTTPTDGYSLLYLALTRADKKVAKILMDAGASLLDDAGKKNIYGETILHTAVREGDQELVELLIKARVDLNVEATAKRTPLFFAVSENIEMVTLLHRAGADATIADSGGRTPLRLALDLGLLEIAHVLIFEAEADIRTRNDNGETFIHLAARECASSMDYDVFFVEVFLGYPEVDINAKDNLGQTPLHVAIKAKEGKNYYNTLKTLLNNGADIHARDHEDETPLQLLKFQSKFCPEVEEYLSKYLQPKNMKENNIDLNEKNEDSKTENRKRAGDEKKDPEKILGGVNNRWVGLKNDFRESRLRLLDLNENLLKLSAAFDKVIDADC